MKVKKTFVDLADCSSALRSKDGLGSSAASFRNKKGLGKKCTATLREPVARRPASRDRGGECRMAIVAIVAIVAILAMF